MNDLRPFSAWRWVYAVTIGLFLIINVATASRSPIIWVDEVRMNLPAMNFLDGKGLTDFPTSGGDGRFYGGYGLLGVLLQIPWMAVFGRDIVAVRSINFFLVLITAFAISNGARRHGLLGTREGAFLCFLLIILSNGIAFNYRSGRTDVSMILSIALAFWSAAISNRLWRRGALLVCGALMTLSGLQTLFLAAFLGPLLLLFPTRRFLPGMLWTALGALLGLVLLLWVLEAAGVVQEFYRLYFHHTGTNVAGRASKLARLPGLEALRREPSSLALLPMLALAVIAGFRRRRTWLLSLFGLLAILTTHAGMIYLYKFPTYYSWIFFLPMALAAAALAECSWEAPRPVWRGVVAAGCIAASIGAGLPLRVAMLVSQWEDRDPAPMEAFVRSNIGPKEHAFVGYEAGYAMQGHGAPVYFPSLIDRVSGAAMGEISVVVIPPLSLYGNPIHGEWVQVASFGPPPTEWHDYPFWKRLGIPISYRFLVYRRAKVSSP